MQISQLLSELKRVDGVGFADILGNRGICYENLV